MTFRKTTLLISFLFFLYPILTSGLSVNYGFLLFPLFYLLIDGKVRRPQKIFILMMGLFTLIFLIASVYQYEFFDESLRRIISFVIFMSMFSFMFVKMDAEMIESFKISIVVVCLYFSLHSLFSFFMLGGSSYGFGAKIMIGSQRFGFIYLIGIWLTYFYQSRKKYYLVIKYFVLLILLAGLFLTFSRASIIGLLGSSGIFVLTKCLKWLRGPNFKMFSKSVLSIAATGLLIILLFRLVPVTFSFFHENLFVYLSDSNAIKEDIGNPESSGGTRFFIIGKILDYVIYNPLTGSGYLGVWVLDDPLFGSAHNQYADVLFRTGLLGFCAYIYLLFLLVKYLHRNETGFFWGFIGILFYGVFHETFKESQGGFVLAFLLGMMSHSLRKSKGNSIKEGIPFCKRGNNKKVISA